MKKLLLSFTLTLLVVGLSFAQTRDNRNTRDKMDQKKKENYEKKETSLNQLPSAVVTALSDNGIQAANVVNVYEFSPDDSNRANQRQGQGQGLGQGQTQGQSQGRANQADGKMYKVKVNKDGEMHKFKIDANGNILDKGKWEKSDDTPSY
ncbi:MAG: hypothetical protein ACFCUU_16570 [Cyclobacteriaceae bacterium]